MTTAAPLRIGPGLALATLGAVAFSGKAILAKLMYRHGVDAVQVLAYDAALGVRTGPAAAAAATNTSRCWGSGIRTENAARTGDVMATSSSTP